MTHDDYQTSMAKAEQRHARRSKVARFNAIAGTVALTVGMMMAEAARADGGFGAEGPDRMWMWIVAGTLVIYLTVEKRLASFQLEAEHGNLRAMHLAQQHHEEMISALRGGPTA